MKHRRPSCYTDWRAIYQREVYSLGHTMEVWARLGDGRSVVIGRSLWALLHRIRRIHRRLDVEHEVMDPTFCEAILRAVYQ